MGKGNAGSSKLFEALCHITTMSWPPEITTAQIIMKPRPPAGPAPIWVIRAQKDDNAQNSAQDDNAQKDDNALKDDNAQKDDTQQITNPPKWINHCDCKASHIRMWQDFRTCQKK